MNPILPVWSSAYRYFFVRIPVLQTLHSDKSKLLEYRDPRFNKLVLPLPTPVTEPTVLWSFRSAESKLCNLVQNLQIPMILKENPNLVFLFETPKEFSTQFTSTPKTIRRYQHKSRWYPNKKWLCVVFLGVCIDERLKMKRNLCMF